MSGVSENDFLALRQQVASLQATSDEMVKYRGFWGEAWPKGLTILKGAAWTVGIVGGIFTGATIFYGVRVLRQLSQDNTLARHTAEMSLINQIAKEYSSSEMFTAVNAVHQAAQQPPTNIEGTALDYHRRMVAHFWIRIAIMVTEGVREDLLLKYFAEGTDDWFSLERLERLKLREMYMRQGAEPAAVEARVDAEMLKHPVHILHQRWTKRQASSVAEPPIPSH